MIYVYSFIPKSELIGFINFFVINVVGCFLDMVLAFMALFSQGQSTSTTRLTKLASIMDNIRWVVSTLFPSVNLKRALYNIRLKSNPDCVSALNLLMLTNYSNKEPWMAAREPGLGIQFIIFWAQIIFWWVLLTLIENGTHLKLTCRRSCRCDNDLEQIDGGDQNDGEDGAISVASNQWNDTVCQKNFFFNRKFHCFIV
jgi:hypothetical protein